MAHARTFLTFQIDVSHTAESFFERVRLKTIVHPEETSEHLYARVLTLCHVAAPELDFRNELFDPKIPTMDAKDSIENVSHWIQVGKINAKKLKRAIQQCPTADIRVYFCSEEELAFFCQELKGSKENWIQSVRFFRFEEGFLAALEGNLDGNLDWSLTFVDSDFFLTSGFLDLHSSIAELDMWQEFQYSIANV